MEQGTARGDGGRAGERRLGGALVTPKPPRRPWETGEKLQKSCSHPGPTLSSLRVSAFPE